MNNDGTRRLVYRLEQAEGSAVVFSAEILRCVLIQWCAPAVYKQRCVAWGGIASCVRGLYQRKSCSDVGSCGFRIDSPTKDVQLAPKSTVEVYSCDVSIF